jgi:hypothetical protein
MLKRLITLATVLLISVPSLAAASFTVTPLLIDRDVEPRDILTEEITITNVSSVPLRLFASVNEIVLDEGGGIKEFVSPSVADSSVEVTSWIEVRRGRISIAPGETVTVPVTLRISPTAKPGNYQAFIGFAHGSNVDEAQAKIFAGAGIGSIVRVQIEDDVNVLLRLMRFSVDRFVTTLKEHSVSFSMENPGDVALVPDGEIIIYNTRGEEVTSYPVNAERAEIAPGSVKDFSVPIIPDGLFGRYKAYLTLEYGDTQRAALYDTTFFYAVPVPMLVGIFVAILCTVLLMLFLLRHRFAHDHHHDDDDGHVTLYVRPGVAREEVPHDIDLKKPSTPTTAV